MREAARTSEGEGFSENQLPWDEGYCLPALWEVVYTGSWRQGQNAHRDVQERGARPTQGSAGSRRGRGREWRGRKRENESSAFGFLKIKVSEQEKKLESSNSREQVHTHTHTHTHSWARSYKARNKLQLTSVFQAQRGADGGHLG